MSNATDSEDRIKAGFAALLQRLEADSLPDPDMAKRANEKARQDAENRTWREYTELGLTPPSPFALSITARRVMAQAAEVKAMNRASREAAE